MKNTGKYNVYHGVIAVGRWVLFAIVAFLILFPVYWIFISSITPAGELFKTPIIFRIIPHWIATHFCYRMLDCFQRLETPY